MKYKKIIVLLAVAVFPFVGFAQSAMVKKAAKSMFRLTTFDNQGSVLHSGYGAFVSEDGVCLSNWDAFVDAYSASVIDAQGRKYNVECMIGANEIYNVAKFRVAVPQDKKMAIIPIAIANTKVAVGGESWLVEYNVKSPVLKKFSPTTVESFGNDYPYYIYEESAPEELTGSPFLNANGELMGLMQQAKKRTDLYCAGAQFAMAMETDVLSTRNATLRQTKIRAGLPDDYQQALVALTLQHGNIESKSYLDIADEFVRKFPTASDGYNAKIEYYVGQKNYDEVSKVVETALQQCEKKDEPHYALARNMYNALVIFSDSVAKTVWNLDDAMKHVNEAYAISPLPVYMLMKGQIQYAQKNYADAYDSFIAVSKSEIRNADNFYCAAQSLMAQEAESDKIVAMLDSMVACLEKPYDVTAGNYIFIRADYLSSIGQGRKAVVDLNACEEDLAKVLGPQFYYRREQLELKNRMYQLALNDINKAISLSPEAIFHAEKCLLLIKVNKHEDAVEATREAIALYPQYADLHAILGVSLIQTGKKEEGMKSLEKAKELGSYMLEPLKKAYGL